ncbi:TSR1-like protein [Mya arenaria]|uniref:TSR1-like protein n=1 Tax=Mya arenaria TaxID=6604 RepID=A0ABY7DX73_MYAAR|nr:TSR1-like protein [Mya arenaria]
MIVHRPGPLKQQNKTHKHGKHRSKSQREEGGRVSVKTISKKATSVKRKNDRKHQLVLALHSDVDVSDFVKSLLACDDTLSTEKAGSNITHVSPYGNLYSVLDGAKSADSLVLVVSPDKGVDSFGEGCLSCLLGQGMPAVTIVTKGLKFPDEKVHTPDSQQEFMLILRQITSQKLRDIHFRENRAYLMSEHVSFEVSKDSEEYGTLKVTGYVRSRTLNTNRLVHVTGLGDFQLSQVDLLEDPHPLQPRKAKQDVEMAEGSEPTVLSVVKPDPAKQEGLLTEAEIDPMEGEQTWPTEEELAQAEASQKQMKRRVPKGTSDYQASWILEDEDAAEGDVEMDEGSDADMEDDIEAEADIAEPDSDGLSDNHCW